MSKFNNLEPYRMAFDERVVELNGPEIGLIMTWYNKVKKTDSLVAAESASLIPTLDRGPIFQFHEPLLVTLKQISFVFMWHQINGFPDDELSKTVLMAFAVAKEGKKRPDLIPQEEKKVEEPTEIPAEDKPDVKED